MGKWSAAFVAAMALALGSAATAGATPLLTSSAETQIESWLGMGDLTFTNIFTKEPGLNDNATAWHSAADSAGPTITLLDATVNNQTFLVGGYDPQSWSSSNEYNLSPSTANRTAFIFDLTASSPVVMYQKTEPIGMPEETQGYSYTYYIDSGLYQTADVPGYGPAWGGGYDLAVNSDDLSTGYATAWSYGSGANFSGNAGIIPILTGSYSCGNQSQLTCGYTRFGVGALETYTIEPLRQPAPVPEPASIALLGTGLAAVIVRARRRRQA